MKSAFAILALMSLLASPALSADPAPSGKTESAVIGGGCFWCVEAQYKMLKGVQKVVSGYAGGTVDNPTYKQVCNGDTGHAEVIRIDYDPDIITFKDIIDLFWLAHDPTTLNRQGNDEGTQYRSTIMYSSEEQKKIAEASMAEAQKEIQGRIVTEIVALKKFYPAEDYHQDYFANNPYQGYCRVVVSPKVAKFKKKLEEKAKLKAEAK
ncbi:MAG: Peptide methionine sulfoxide reductase MsrA [Prosthecobacter sp.]|nr:Peptide methionine sulfoxide reductase MsrA [Prosthecobacter sp.]